MDVRGQRTIAAAQQTSSIAIVGGGLVGSLAALSMARLCRAAGYELRINVFEQNHQPSMAVAKSLTAENEYATQYDARNVVLSNATAEFLKQLSVWSALEKALVPIEKLHISRLHGLGSSCILAQDEGVQALGYVADMAQLAREFVGLAMQDPSINYHFGAKIEAIKPLQSGYRLHWRQEEELEQAFDLVMVADGYNSFICQNLGLTATQRQYSQQALVANVSMDQAMPNTAYEQFFNGGAITLLPLTQQGFSQRMGLVWIDHADRLTELQSLSEARFLQQLAQKLPLQAAYLKIGQTKIYPLNYQLRQERVRPHLVVIGNAAQSLHPIAAQGFNLAVRDVRDFAEMSIANAGKKNSSELALEFSGDAMQIFAKWRARDVQNVERFVDGLQSLFLTPAKTPVKSALQDLALLGFEFVPGAKAALSRFAMGGRARRR